tara:strand:- start:46677 stop:53717 length:7041 start_codon:yes stop_codon:yes gene_type:complete
MSCIRFTPQNETLESLLFNKLYEIVNQDEETAHELYSYFRSEEGLEAFGNYIQPLDVTMNDNTMNYRTDENGEPLLIHDDVLNKYYFLDVNDERVYYPYNQGLVQHFDVADIMELRETMALKYYEKLDFNFDKRTFLNVEEHKVKAIIEEFIDYKVDELRRDPDVFVQQLAESLEDSREYLNEWVQEVRDFFETKGLIIKKNQIEAEERNEDDVKSVNPRESVTRPEAFTVDRKSSVNANIKLYLSLLKGDSFNKYNELTFIPFDDVFTTLNTILANTIPTEIDGNLNNIYDLFLRKIDEHGQYKPYLKQLHNKIQTIESEHFKYQFVNAFFLARKKFLGSDIIIEKGKFTYEIKDISEVSSRKRSIVSQWEINLNKLNTSFKAFSSFTSGMSNSIKSLQDNSNQIQYDVTFDKLLKGLNSLGISATPSGLKYLINQAASDTSLEAKTASMDTIVTNMQHAVADHDVETPIANLLTNSAFVKVASAESFFLSEGSDASFYSVGKNRWLYSLYSHLEKTVLNWQEDPSLLRAHIESSAFTKGSHYAEYYLADDFPEEDRAEESKKRIKEIEAFVFNSVQIKNESVDAVDNKNIFYVDAVADYINKMFNYLKPNGKVYHKTALAADKATEYQMSWGRDASVFMMEANAVETADGFKLNKDVKEVFFKYFKSDYYRIEEVHQAIEDSKTDPSINLKVHYHTGAANGKVSQLFPSLSPIFDSKGRATNPQGLGEVLYDETGRPIYDNLDEDNLRAAIMPVIEKALLDNIRQTVKTLEGNNIAYYTISGFRKFQGIDESILDKYIGEARKYKKDLTETDIAKRKARVEKGFFGLAADLTINSLISQVEYSKLISGDTAYYKNVNDYKKRVPATYTDGQYLTILDSADKYFNAAVINKVEFTTPNLKLLKKRLPRRIWEQYEEVNAADAQGYITPQRWMFIMKRLGKGLEAAPIYTKMFEDKPTFTAKELKLLAQPLKGVYFSNKGGHPVFLKYSQAVLLPRMIRNTPLEGLYEQMKKQGVDELITLDAMKVGAESPVTTHDVDGNVLTDVTFNVMELDNANWKLQQDLPTKGIKERELGSQIQKNIFQGLVFNKDATFNVAGQEASNVEMIVLLNDLFGALSNHGTEKFFKQLGVSRDDYTIKNEDGLYINLLNQFKSRTSTTKNNVNALQSRTSPFGVPSTYNIFQNVFSAMSNSNSVKIKTSGGGFIQMADYGLSKSEAKSQGIIFTPWFDKKAEKLSPPVTGINPVTGKEIIKPGGIFLSGSFIAKHIPNYAKLSSKQLFGTLNEETGKYEGGKIDERILRNIIGYRIPNQSLSSNDAVEIMGILPEEIGDTVIAYTGITEKTGSDFDIDKMYLMVPSFDAHYSSPKDPNPYKLAFNYMEDNEWSKEKLLHEIYSLGEVPTGTVEGDKAIVGKAMMEDQSYEYFQSFREYKDVNPARELVYSEMEEGLSLEQQSTKALQNKLIEAYKAVLLHPKTYAQMMNPIEVPHIKDDIKNMLPDEAPTDLENFSGVRDLQLKSNFRLGKTGLGQVINFLVDSVRGSMGTLVFNNDGFAWGNFDMEGNTVFDKRFSETLSQDEKDSYMKSYNENLKEGETAMTSERMDELEKLESTETFMGLVNGFVDIANEEYIVRGNWKTKTNGIGLSMVRAGIHPFRVNAFLMQPFIQEFVNYSDMLNAKNNIQKGKIEYLFKLNKVHGDFKNLGDYEANGITLNAEEVVKRVLTYSNTVKRINFSNADNYDRTTTNVFKKVKSELYKQFEADDKSEDIEDLDNIVQDLRDAFDTYFNAPPVKLREINLYDLREQVNKPDDSVQIGMFEVYLNYAMKAAKLGKIVKANKSDVDGKGKNITSNIVTLNLIKQVKNVYKEGDIMGYDTLLNYAESPTILNHAIINGVSTPFQIMQANKKFFPTAAPGAVRTFNFISRLLGDENLLDQDLGDNLERSYYSYLMSGFKPLQMTVKEKGTLLNELPKEYREMKKLYPDNVLLQELTEVEAEVKKFFYLTMSSSKKNPSKINAIIDSWLDLMEQEPEFSDRLIKYSFIESSFGKSITQFHEFIPYQWFNKHRINSYLKELSLDDYIVDWNFVDQFFRNNLENLDNSSSPLESHNSGYSKLDRTGKYLRVGPVITEKNETKVKYIATHDPATDDMAAAYTQGFGSPNSKMPTTKYYKIVGMNEFHNPIYARTSPLGVKDENGNRFSEYSMQTIDNPVGLISLYSANTSQYLTKQLVNLENLENITKTAANYELPTYFYANLDTKAIQPEEISAEANAKKSKKVMPKALELEYIKEGDRVFNKEGNAFLYRGIRTEEGIGKGSIRLEDSENVIKLAGENTLLYGTNPKEKKSEGLSLKCN